MENFPDLAWLGDVTAVPLAALVTLGVISIFRGTWTPERVTARIEQDRDAWQKAYELERDAHAVTRQQNSQLIDAGKTTAKVLESITEIGGPG